MKLGFPARILTDQGTQFQSELFTELCRFANIHKMRTSPYEASTNGMVERWHKTLNSMLAKVVSETHKDWPNHLPSVVAAYNATIHQATGYSPNRLVFGREVRLPTDLECGLSPQTSHFTSYDSYAEELANRQIADFQAVRENLGRAAEHRKRHYDLNLKPAETININNKVWYYYP